MYWKSEPLNMYRLYEDGHNHALVFLEKSRWTWRVFLDYLGIDPDEDPGAMNTEQLEGWDFGDLISRRINTGFQCLEGFEDSLKGARNSAEAVVTAVRQKAEEARILEEAEYGRSEISPRLPR